MKNGFRLRLTICVLFFSLLLTGCSESDWEYLLMGLMAWGEEHNIIVNEEFQPSALAVVVARDTADDWMNTLESVQLDGLEVVRDIEQANELSDQAVASLDSKLMQEAIALRPNDWVLHEKDAIIWGAYHNGAAADAALLQADTLLQESLRIGDDCVVARQAQLNQRRALLFDEIERQEKGAEEGYGATELREMYETTSTEIREIESSGWTEFCSAFSN